MLELLQTTMPPSAILHSLLANGWKLQVRLAQHQGQGKLSFTAEVYRGREYVSAPGETPLSAIYQLLTCDKITKE